MATAGYQPGYHAQQGYQAQQGTDASNPWQKYNPGLAKPVLPDFVSPKVVPNVPPKAGLPRSQAPSQYRKPQERFTFNSLGERQDKINWKGEEIIPVQKNFSGIHPNVEARTPEECEIIRMRHGIDAKVFDQSVEMPKPVEDLEEALFPDWAASVLRDRGWVKPSPIQIMAWPVALRGYDLIGIACTGSGKTMAYVLPMLIHIMAQPELRPAEGPIGLVLLPSRELCDQVAESIGTFTPHTQVKCVSVCGGEDIDEQSLQFLERVDIMVATPGRLQTLLEQKRTNLKRVTVLVLDEADQMLESDFERQVKTIMTMIRPDRQVLLFSATWQDTVERFARDVCAERSEFMGSGLVEGLVQVSVGGTKLAACETIDQQFWCPGRKDENDPMAFWHRSETKMRALVKAVQKILPCIEAEGTKGLIFVNQTDMVQQVVEELRKYDIPCVGFVGSSTPADRKALLERFRLRDSDLPFLVSTQVLGRGLDFHSVKFVVNFDMPDRIVDYIHRIGRTGRMGEEGFSLTLLEELDCRFAKDLCECLKATGHRRPEWLEREAARSKKLWKEYRALEAEGATLPQAGCLRWKGRGTGRREEFLEELKGCGLARGVALTMGSGAPAAS